MYWDTARELGAGLAQRGYSVVFGGGKRGLMGALANAAMDAGGYVLGIMPEALKSQELALEDVDEFVVTRDMRERKETMMRHADAFVVLPGGFGTWDEFFETITHRLLGFHDKPCIILNQNSYYAPLLEMFERACREGFVREEYRKLYHLAGSVAEVLDLLEREMP
jgi:cytokinin riboside 5'-monophosphate phosphoribohydrolase